METGRPNPLKAEMFAEIKHSGQTYNDEVPYTFHLKNVVKILERFDLIDPIWICAAWLHDVIEDTTASYNDVNTRFGLEVAEMVYCVTSELGRNREERNKKTYPKIAGNKNAILLKLADRIANVEYGLASGGKTDMYAKEFPSFYAGIRTQNDMSMTEMAMWNHLKRLLRVE